METELPLVREEKVKNYIANFYLTEKYQSFAAYWRRFGYAEMVEKVEELFLNLKTTILR